MADEGQVAQEKRPASRERTSRPSSREPNGATGAVGAISSVPVLPGRLGAYDVQKAVGRGGYAIVFKGVRHEDGRVVAIKKVEVFEMSPKKRERCLQEVTLLAQLHHPNIIQMLDAFIDENMLIIVFEWAPAGDLKRLIKKTAESGKTLDEAAIWSFFMQIVDGLRYMHAHRIMHRDIKPANVLVGANGALKLGDLGLGRQLSEQTMEAFSKVGTPYYVSPEVVRGAGYDWKSDVWSMGCLLYELACLRSPFEMEGANLYDVFQKISKGEFEPIPADQFSAPLRQIVARMLQIEPAKRPELEEVWNIGSAVMQAQSRSKHDIHSMAIDVYEQSLLLEAELLSAASPAPSSRPGSSNAPSGPNNSNAGRRATAAAAAAAPPPSDTLRLLHPLYFAEPLVSPLRADADRFQKQQLGAMMHIFAWLLRLNGKADYAQAVELQLEFHPSGRASSSQVKPASSSKGFSRSSKGQSSIRAAGSSQALQPVCVAVLKGAEAVKKGLQALSINTEFAPVSAIALGHGRTACSVLQDTLAATVQRLPLTVRPIQRPLEPPAEEVAEIDPAEIDGKDDIASAEPAGIPDGDDDEDGMGFPASLLPPSMAGSAQQERALEGLAGTAGTSGRHRPGIDPSRAPLHATAIDPVAWRTEVERLGLTLNRIMVPAGGIRSGHDPWAGDWLLRWESVKGSVAALGQQAPQAVAGLRKLQGIVEGELDRVATAEARLNDNCADLLAQYSGDAARLRRAEHDRASHDELVTMGHAALQQLNEQIEHVQGQIQERSEQLDGTLAVAAIRDAIRKLQKEMRQMEIRIGVMQQAVTARQCKNMLSAVTGGGTGQGGVRQDDDDHESKHRET